MNIFFCEDQGRYIIEINKENLDKVEGILKDNSVHFDKLGTVTDNSLEIDEKSILSIDELINANKKWLRDYMVN
mgnify:FL=1